MDQYIDNILYYIIQVKRWHLYMYFEEYHAFISDFKSQSVARVLPRNALKHRLSQIHRIYI